MLLSCVVHLFAKVPMPEDVAAFAAAKRAELVERVAEVDEELGELFLEEAPIDAAALRCPDPNPEASLAKQPARHAASCTMYMCACVPWCYSCHALLCCSKHSSWQRASCRA